MSHHHQVNGLVDCRAAADAPSTAADAAALKRMTEAQFQKLLERSTAFNNKPRTAGDDETADTEVEHIYETLRRRTTDSSSGAGAGVLSSAFGSGERLHADDIAQNNHVSAALSLKTKGPFEDTNNNQSIGVRAPRRCDSSPPDYTAAERAASALQAHHHSTHCNRQTADVDRTASYFGRPTGDNNCDCHAVAQPPQQQQQQQQQSVAGECRVNMPPDDDIGYIDDQHQQQQHDTTTAAKRAPTVDNNNCTDAAAAAVVAPSPEYTEFNSQMSQMMQKVVAANPTKTVRALDSDTEDPNADSPHQQPQPPPSIYPQYVQGSDLELGNMRPYASRLLSPRGTGAGNDSSVPLLGHTAVYRDGYGALPVTHLQRAPRSGSHSADRFERRKQAKQKKQRRITNSNVKKAEDVEGYQGNRSLESLVQFIDGNETSSSGGVQAGKKTKRNAPQPSKAKSPPAGTAAGESSKRKQQHDTTGKQRSGAVSSPTSDTSEVVADTTRDLKVVLDEFAAQQQQRSSSESSDGEDSDGESASSTNAPAAAAHTKFDYNNDRLDTNDPGLYMDDDQLSRFINDHNTSGAAATAVAAAANTRYDDPVDSNILDKAPIAATSARRSSTSALQSDQESLDAFITVQHKKRGGATGGGGGQNRKRLEPRRSYDQAATAVGTNIKPSAVSPNSSGNLQQQQQHRLRAFSGGSSAQFQQPDPTSAQSGSSADDHQPQQQQRSQSQAAGDDASSSGGREPDQYPPLQASQPAGYTHAGRPRPVHAVHLGDFVSASDKRKLNSIATSSSSSSRAGRPEKSSASSSSQQQQQQRASSSLSLQTSASRSGSPSAAGTGSHAAQPAANAAMTSGVANISSPALMQCSTTTAGGGGESAAQQLAQADTHMTALISPPLSSGRTWAAVVDANKQRSSAAAGGSQSPPNHSTASATFSAPSSTSSGNPSASSSGSQPPTTSTTSNQTVDNNVAVSSSSEPAAADTSNNPTSDPTAGDGESATTSQQQQQQQPETLSPATTTNANSSSTACDTSCDTETTSCTSTLTAGTLRPPAGHDDNPNRDELLLPDGDDEEEDRLDFGFARDEPVQFGDLQAADELMIRSQQHQVVTFATGDAQLDQPELCGTASVASDIEFGWDDKPSPVAAAAAAASTDEPTTPVVATASGTTVASDSAAASQRQQSTTAAASSTKSGYTSVQLVIGSGPIQLAVPSALHRDDPDGRGQVYFDPTVMSEAHRQHARLLRDCWNTFHKDGFSTYKCLPTTTTNTTTTATSPSPASQ